MKRPRKIPSIIATHRLILEEIGRFCEEHSAYELQSRSGISRGTIIGWCKRGRGLRLIRDLDRVVSCLGDLP